MALLTLEFALIGLVGGLLGLFYRNCMKVEGMIFHPIYKVFKKWVTHSEFENANLFAKFLGFIAYPLGYCIYCSTTWITFLLVALYLSSWEVLPNWQGIVLAVLIATVVQHLVICVVCRWLINKHPDLDDN